VPAPEVIEWLLSGDVAVQYQTTRDLLGRDEPELQARIATEGQGAALLDARGESGHWGRGFYQPKWTSSHYTLLELKNLGLPRDNAAARESVELILRTEKGEDGGLNPSAGIRHSDVCVNGMALDYSTYFGAPEELLESLVDLLLELRMPDGGFNCRLNRSGARHSSLHTTICTLEGITEYLRDGYTYRGDELREASGEAVDFLLRHRLYRSERTGKVIDPEFTRMHHPPRWHYDILRALDGLRDARVFHDPRMDEALAVLRARQRPDGRWLANRGYPGITHVPPTRGGQPSRWVTLIASRVLAAYEGSS
jgi:hypothetical protein